MPDSDLALLYGIETKDKNQDMRFPKDFLLQLNEKDWEILKSQIVTSSLQGGRREKPIVLNENGFVILSRVNNSVRTHYYYWGKNENKPIKNQGVRMLYLVVGNDLFFLDFS